MNASIEQSVSEINKDGQRKGVLYLTGGGLSALGMLSSHGGMSNTLRSSRVCYAQKDSIEVFGCKPDHFVDEIAARQLAAAAFSHALRVRDDGLNATNVFGVGCTSKLSVGRNERAGRTHEIYGAVMDAWTTYTVSVTLPGGPDRHFEEMINAKLILNLVAVGKRLYDLPTIRLDGFCCTEFVTLEYIGDLCNIHHLNHDHMVSMLTGDRAWIAYQGNVNNNRVPIPGPLYTETPPTQALFPGRWRPKHEGHEGIRRKAESLLKMPVSYELSLFNADKPPLDHKSILETIRQFAQEDCWLVLTKAPTFVEKARIFPNSWWVMGQDTASRLVLPKYYGGMRGLFGMMDELDELGAKFLVFGRADGDEFKTLFNERWPHSRVERFWGDHAQVVPEEEFRIDVSSTQIRRDAQ